MNAQKNFKDQIENIQVKSNWMGVSLRIGIALVLAGYLIFAHGCHGDDVDDELFTFARQLVTSR